MLRDSLLVLSGAALGLLGSWLLQRAARKSPSRTASDSPPQAVVPQGQLAPVAVDETTDEHRVVRRIETILSRRTNRVIVVLERLCDGHNYSAVLRTCEALGIQHVWLIAPPSGDARYEAATLARHRRKFGLLEKVVAADSERRPLNNELTPGSQKWRKCQSVMKFAADMAEDDEHVAAARGAGRFLSVREFDTSASCLEALHADGCTVWATDLGEGAQVLAAGAPWLDEGLPSRLALVFGTESTGVSNELLAAADRRIYWPLNGFAESLNVSVSAALVTQTVLQLYGQSACGDFLSTAPQAELDALREAWAEALARDDVQLAAMRPLLGHVAPFDDLRRPDGFREHNGRMRRDARNVRGHTKLAARSKEAGTATA